MSVSQPPAARQARTRVISVALAGQPNVGKSTVFNLLTGLSQHVGNWPGKTVEQKTGSYHLQGDTEEIELRLVDLPGTYSLTADSPEERIARDFIIRDRPDLVVLIVNVAALERNLYLLAELLALPVPIVVALNMLDVAEQRGIQVDPGVLGAALHLPVVPMVAVKNQGVRELVQTIVAAADGAPAYAPTRPQLDPEHREVAREIEKLVTAAVPAPYPPDWVALKLLEGDTEISQLLRERLSPAEWEQVDAILSRHEDAILAIASSRYEWIARMVRAAVSRPRAGQLVLTDEIDRVATHPFWGLLLLLAILGGVFWMTYAIGGPLQRLLDAYLVDGGATWLRAALAGAPWWLTGVLADGVVAGAGTVLTFLPILVIFFAVLALLEDVGYMARIAYVMDRYMHLMGLHGRSFFPLLLGFGCNVPAVLGTRIIDSPRARLLTILLAPMVPCTARMAVVTVLAPIFFGSGAFWVMWGLIGLSLGTLAVTGVILHRLAFGGRQAAFIMELPLYHRPNVRTIALAVWQRTVAFLQKAGGIIVVFSVVVWLLATFPTRQMDSSYLAEFGRLFVPLGSQMGLNWQMIVALLTSFVAKENTIATLGILFGSGPGGSDLAANLAPVVTPAAGLAFLVVQMLFVPCVATLAVIRQETGGWKWALADLGLLLVISLSVATVVYHAAGWLHVA
ncbi:MAG: ferrous iron transport protein B [Candidatus Limnocylindrales bacterium]